MGNREISLDGFWVDGQVGSRLGLSYEDAYFEPPPQDSALGLVLDALVEELPEDERIVLELRVFARASFREIARHMDWSYGRPGKPRQVNSKRAWRVYQRALGRLREKIGDREWLAALAPRPEVLEHGN